jgi:hypothetical protein
MYIYIYMYPEFESLCWLRVGSNRRRMRVAPIYIIYTYIYIHIYSTICAYTYITHAYTYTHSFPMDPTGSFQPLCLSTPGLGLGAATKYRQSGDSMRPLICTCF